MYSEAGTPAASDPSGRKVVIVENVALHTHLDVGHRPELDTEHLLAIVRGRMADDYEVYAPGRLQVPDVIVKRSDREGVAIQILQQRLRKRTRLRVYALAPAISQRAWKPVGIFRQSRELQPLVDEVVELLRNHELLRP